MGAKQLVALGLRLLALWILVSALQFYGIASALQATNTRWGNPPWTSVLVVAVVILVGLVVWLASGPLARGLMSGLPNTLDAKFSPHQAVAVGCILMGLWWLKTAVVSLAFLWLKAIALSTGSGRSAMAWLGTEDKLYAFSDGLQIGIGLFFVLRSSDMARWLLRHLPSIPEASSEPFDPLVRRAKELGLRQTVRPDVMADLVMQLASHPDALRRFGELEELLRYAPNPYTRSAAARAMLALGSLGAARARHVAGMQLREETDPDVAKDLELLIESPGQQPLAT